MPRFVFTLWEELAGPRRRLGDLLQPQLLPAGELLQHDPRARKVVMASQEEPRSAGNAEIRP